MVAAVSHLALIDSLANYRHRTKADRCRLSWPILRLLPLLLLSLSELSVRHSLPTEPDQNNNNNEYDCRYRARDRSLHLFQSDRKAVQMIKLLKCDIKPLYERFVAAHHNGQAPDSIAGDLEAGREFAVLDKTIDRFTTEALSVLEMRNFCVYDTFSSLATLKSMSDESESKLLTIAYDLVAIELHRAAWRRP